MDKKETLIQNVLEIESPPLLTPCFKKVLRIIPRCSQNVFYCFYSKICICEFKKMLNMHCHLTKILNYGKVSTSK